jgi:hypothetical protein
MRDDTVGWDRVREVQRRGVCITYEERHTQLLCRLLVRSTCETHEGDAHVGPGRIVIEDLDHTNDGTGEVNVACCPSVYSTGFI